MFTFQAAPTGWLSFYPLSIMETDPYGQSEAERRYHVERAFAAVAQRGGVVSPYARHLYGRYVAGELRFGEVRA